MMKALSITLTITDVNMGKYFFILCINIKKKKKNSQKTEGSIDLNKYDQK